MIKERQSIRILLGESQTLLRLGIKKLLKEDDELYVVGEVENGEELIEKYFNLKPDLILTDVYLPKLSGFKAIFKIKEKDETIKALFLTTLINDDCIFNSINAGSLGLIDINIAQDELIFAIKKVYSGEQYFGPGIEQEQLEEIMRLNKKGETLPEKKFNVILTDREREILYLISEAISSSEIAKRLGVCKRTIDKHRTNLMQKLNITTLPKLIRYAVILHLN